MDGEDEEQPPLSARDQNVLGKWLRDTGDGAENEVTMECVTNTLSLSPDLEFMLIDPFEGEHKEAEIVVNPATQLAGAPPVVQESLSLISSEGLKQQRQAAEQTLQSVGHLQLVLPSTSSIEELPISGVEIPVPDIEVPVLAAKRPLLEAGQSCQSELPQFDDVERRKRCRLEPIADRNLETVIACMEPSLLQTLPSPSHENLNVDSPCVPIHDEDDVSNCGFGPEYFQDYVTCDNDVPIAAPIDFEDFIESQETVCSEDESTDETTYTGPAGKKENPLYKGASINEWESLTSILSFVASEHLSSAGLVRLLTLINLHLPKPNNLIKNTASLWKVLEELDDPVYLHYFCSVCYKIRKNSSDICDTCNDESKCVQFFISLPLMPQLKRMFARPGFKENLNYKHTRSKKNADNIEDVYDSYNYKEAEKKFEDSCINLTTMFNTDGMQVFNSSTYSLWPFYLVINELPPNMRFRSEHLLIAGLWGSVIKPHPNVFLLPIYKDLKVLEKGIDVQCHQEENTTKVVATVISGSCDAPACACFMNMKGHAGFYSCRVCLIKGEKPNPKQATVFPYEDHLVLRNMPQYEEHKRWAVEKRVIVLSNPKNEEKWCGIKGPTILSHILPNMFESMNIDAMHCVYLGQMRALLHLWTDKDYKDKPFSCYSKLKIINSRLQKVASPHFLQRSVQSLHKLVHWKASELRYFMFCLCLAILHDILKPEYYVHLAYFVSGVALLNSSSISEEDLVLASLYLNQFVSQFSSLYGSENMTSNLHKLLHLARCVRLNGPLFLTSCFPFEDMNGRLANFIHGTRYVGLQIHTNLSIVAMLRQNSSSDAGRVGSPSCSGWT